MNYPTFVSNVVIALLTFSAVHSTAAKEELILVDRVAAVVEDDVITLREVYGQMPPMTDAAERENMLRQMLGRMVEEKLLDREVQSMRDQLGVSEADVDRAIEEIQRMNGLTRDQLKDALYRQGMSWSEYRKKLRQQIERMRLVQFKVHSRVAISEQMVKAACLAESGARQIESISLAHILVAVGEDVAPQQAAAFEQKAKKIKAQLDQGADFAKLVAQYSDDDRSADGDLGTFKRGQLFDEIERVAFGLSEGQIAGPVRSPLGWHIIKLTGSQTASSSRCNDPQHLQNVQQKLFQEESTRQMQAWIEQLKRKVYIEIRL